jgi:retinol dehydrogenase 12
VIRTVLATGGGRGLGRVTAEKLAILGHRAMLAARTPSAAKAAVDQIRRRHPQVGLEARAVDLSSLTRVRAFASSQAGRGEPIDVLFHIAGAGRRA